MPGTKPDEMVSVAQMNKPCSYPIGRRDTRTSLTCDRTATSAILLPDAPTARPRFRCDKHEGIWDIDTVGEVFSEMPSAPMQAFS